MRNLMFVLLILGGCSKETAPALPLPQTARAPSTPAPPEKSAPAAPALPPGFPPQLVDQGFKQEVATIYASLLPAFSHMGGDNGAGHLAIVSGFRIVSSSPEQTRRRVAALLQFMDANQNFGDRYKRATKKSLFDDQGHYADLVSAMKFLQADTLRFYGSKDRAARVLAEDMGGRENSAGFLAVDFVQTEKMAGIIGAALAQK